MTPRRILVSAPIWLRLPNPTSSVPIGAVVVGGTEVDIGGLNLVSDGDVRLDAGANGDIRQSLRDLVEQYEHPFTVSPDNRVNLADTLDTEPLLSDLLDQSSRSCYAEIADCGFAVSTLGTADIQLNGRQIEAGAGQFSAGGDFTATASSGLQLGTVSTAQVLSLSNSEGLSLGGSLSGGTVSLSTGGSFSNTGALSITAGSGGLRIDAGSIASTGLLSLSSAGGLQLLANSISLSGHALSATGAARLEAGTISLGAGSLTGGSLALVAQSALNLTGSTLVSIYAAMGLVWGVGALIGPPLAGLAMQTTRHGLPLFVAVACALFMAAALCFRDAAPRKPL